LSWDQTEAGFESAVTAAANAGLEDIIFDSMMQSISLAPVETNCVVNSASKETVTEFAILFMTKESL